jgi:hypothetical protein
MKVLNSKLMCAHRMQFYLINEARTRDVLSEARGERLWQLAQNRPLFLAVSVEQLAVVGVQIGARLLARVKEARVLVRPRPIVHLRAVRPVELSRLPPDVIRVHPKTIHLCEIKNKFA